VQLSKDDVFSQNSLDRRLGICATHKLLVGWALSILAYFQLIYKEHKKKINLAP
jgi:hypothetical protein